MCETWRKATTMTAMTLFCSNVFASTDIHVQRTAEKIYGVDKCRAHFSFGARQEQRRVQSSEILIACTFRPHYSNR